MSEPRPVLMVSAGRSGSSLLHHLLSAHDHTAWLPARILERGPEALRRGIQRSLRRTRRALRAVDLPLVGNTARRAFAPGEAYDLWDHLSPGFSDPRRDLGATDLTEAACQGIRAAFAQCTTHRRRRLLLKITGWPRLGFLSRAFPGARFVHIARDPRAVACSFLTVPWWRGREGPQHWRWGELSSEHRQLWAQHGETPLALACLQQRIFWDALDASQSMLPANALHDVAYDDLCTRPEATLQRVLLHCHLDPSSRLNAALETTPIRSADTRWNQSLTPHERQTVEDLLAPCLARYRQIGAPVTR